MSVRVEIWAKDFTRLAFATPLTVEAVARRYARSSATFTVDPASDAAVAALEPGARALVLYDTPGGNVRQVVAGPVRANPKGPAVAAGEVAVDGDWLDVLAWPKPASAITAQTDEFHRVTGAAETVLKTYVNAAVTRIGLPYTVPATGGLGSSVKWALRNAPLGDEVAKIATAGGIEVATTQIVGGLELDVYEGVDRTQIALSEVGGTITDWSMQINPPTVTRAVAGGFGEKATRQFRAYVGTAVEAAWGLVREVFVDAGDVEEDDFTELTARAQRAVAAGAATYSLTASIAEADFLRVGDTCWLGDLVLLEPIPGISQVQAVTEIKVTGTAEDGWRAVPTAGDPDSTPDRLTVAAVRALASAVRKEGAR